MKDIYTMLKEGMTQEQIKEILDAEFDAADKRIAIEKEQAEMRAKDAERRNIARDRARDYLVEAFLEYNDFYGWIEPEKLDEETVAYIRKLISRVERYLGMIHDFDILEW